MFDEPFIVCLTVRVLMMVRWPIRYVLVRAMLNSSTLNGLMSKSPLRSRLVLNPA
jgi:hypothetical protein